MNDLELREHFEEWAEPLRAATPPGMAVLRRRIRRRRAKMAAAAGSALAVTGIVAGLLVSGVVTSTEGLGPADGSKPSFSITVRALPTFQPGRYAVPPGAPYILLTGYGNTSGRLINAATGNLVQRFRPMVKGTFFSAMAAAPDDRQFVLGQQSSVGGRTSFVELQVTGTRARLTRALPGVLLPAGDGIYGMTVNPAGTRLAMNVEGRDGIGPMHLLIYNVATGALLGNFSEAGGTVSLQYWPSADKLAFSYLATSGTAGSGLRVLDTSTAAGAGTSLLADSALDPAVRGFALGSFSSDGSTVMNVARANTSMVLREWSAISGRLLHTVRIGTAAANNQSANYCGIVWASADGLELLTQCGTEQLEVIVGATVPAKLAVTLPASQAGGVDTFAW